MQLLHETNTSCGGFNENATFPTYKDLTDYINESKGKPSTFLLSSPIDGVSNPLSINFFYAKKHKYKPLSFSFDNYSEKSLMVYIQAWYYKKDNNWIPLDIYAPPPSCACGNNYLAVLVKPKININEYFSDNVTFCELGEGPIVRGTLPAGGYRMLLYRPLIKNYIINISRKYHFDFTIPE